MEETQEQQVTEQAEQQVPETDYSAFDAHIQGLQDQAAELAGDFPEFQLEQELQNPVFLQLTAPGTGISVADAYYALHRQQIQQASARQEREKVVSAIQSGARCWQTCRPARASRESAFSLPLRRHCVRLPWSR